MRIHASRALVPLLAAVLLAGCATTRVSSGGGLNAAPVDGTTKEQSLKRKVAIARFSNETTYAKGAFYDRENDPLGKQAVDILSAKLAATNKFILLERSDLDLIASEAEYAGITPQKIGADYLIIGSLTKYGRKNVGKTGLISRTKVQVVEAGVSLRLVDVATGQIIYSEEAEGEAETSASTVLGMGSSAGFDATLSDKAIDAAIAQLVENVVNNCLNRPWKSYFLQVSEGSAIISGGKSQGLRPGDTFDVLKRGESVVNPQTGMKIELPGTKVGSVTVAQTGGDDPNNEYSIVTLTGTVDSRQLGSYIIQERQ